MSMAAFAIPLHPMPARPDDWEESPEAVRKFLLE
jgi:hypothetical protein